ncbi:hypothetical protein RclHR1_00070025 [Rhizophagus clarus]|uniref:Uncharacterized protein n=1 Tax=Rhizophagus clarus TaxID=94130 RepID=A0A2Z6RU88_9GLOM|nr:hypothetical protein RclHR1_00070025 [Rhizophagus clarus]GES78197.1 hypothetical protein RCL_jg29681.t1 [Rhizophagus clarus]
MSKSNNRRKLWSKEDDNYILELMKQNPCRSWVRISQILSRNPNTPNTAKNIRERWIERLTDLHFQTLVPNNNSRNGLIFYGKDLVKISIERMVRALLDKNNVFILRSNEKFLTWEIPSAKNLDQQQRNLKAFQLFRLHYFKTLFNNSKHRSIKASKLIKINAEINEAWNDSEIIRENYEKLALDIKLSENPNADEF